MGCLRLGCSVQAICDEKYRVVVCDRFTKQTRIANMEKITHLIVSGVEDISSSEFDSISPPRLLVRQWFNVTRF